MKLKKILCIILYGGQLLAQENLVQAGVNLDFLIEALSYNTGGSAGKAYYSLEIAGQRIGGERPWETRWALIKPALDFEGKKILELGCNMAICSQYLLTFAHAKAAVGVELPSRHSTIRAAKKLQQAFHNKDNFELALIDLNKDPYEEQLGYDYDVAICMSILKWVDDKERLLSYLAHFKQVIFEWHDLDEIEINRFKRHGFTEIIYLGKTQIGTSYGSNQYRTLFLFSK